MISGKAVRLFILSVKLKPSDLATNSKKAPTNLATAARLLIKILKKFISEGDSRSQQKRLSIGSNEDEKLIHELLQPSRQLKTYRKMSHRAMMHDILKTYLSTNFTTRCLIRGQTQTNVWFEDKHRLGTHPLMNFERQGSYSLRSKQEPRLEADNQKTNAKLQTHITRKSCQSVKGRRKFDARAVAAVRATKEIYKMSRTAMMHDIPKTYLSTIFTVQCLIRGQTQIGNTHWRISKEKEATDQSKNHNLKQTSNQKTNAKLQTHITCQTVTDIRTHVNKVTRDSESLGEF